jgi:hypothetical protein
MEPSGTDWSAKMRTQGALGYAFEQFSGALRSLAIGREPLSERLWRAWAYRITHVREQDLGDTKLAERIAAIKQQLHSLGDLNEDQEVVLADEIVSVYSEIIEQLAMRSSPG